MLWSDGRPDPVLSRSFLGVYWQNWNMCGRLQTIPMDTIETRYARVAGAELRTRHRGAGEPVLLTHGVPGDLGTLAPVADQLADRYHAITVSLRHAEMGCDGDRPFGTTQQRDDLRDLIPLLGAGPVHLVAWSYSAHAALALAVEAPDLVRSVFVCEPGFPTFVHDPEKQLLVHEDMMAAFGPVFGAISGGDLSTALRLAIDGAAGASGWFDAQPLHIRAIHERSAHMLRLLPTQTPALPLDGQALGRISCPVTLSWGSDTRACYRLVSEAAASRLPGARRIVVEGAGHLLPEADPEAFAVQVLVHLDQFA